MPYQQFPYSLTVPPDWLPPSRIATVVPLPALDDTQEMDAVQPPALEPVPGSAEAKLARAAESMEYIVTLLEAEQVENMRLKAENAELRAENDLLRAAALGVEVEDLPPAEF